MKKANYLLFLLFGLSGFSGLIYESIWSHYIRLILGHAAYAQTLVLTIFMGGLAIGAWLVSRIASRISKPLLWYAVIEGVVGVFGVFFHQEFLLLQNFLFEHALQFGETPATTAIIKWSVASLLLLPQAVLLGTTFPLMSSTIIRFNTKSSGNILGMLYFSNSIGAAIGVLFSGFILIEMVGLPGTSLTAGIINIFLALIAWGIAKSLPTPDQSSEKRIPVSQAAASHLLVVVAIFTGTASFFYEIGWIRMLSLVLSSSVQSFELMLSAFIFGLAFGSYFIRRRIDRLVSPGVYLAWIQIIMGLFAAATLPLYVESFSIMSFMFQGLTKTDSGYLLFNFGSQVIALMLMLPATFMAGMTLPLLTNTLLKSGGNESAIGQIYAANTLGAIIGISLAIHVVMPANGVKSLIIVGSLVDIILGVVLLKAYANSSVTRPGIAVPMVSALVLVGIFWLTPFDEAVLSSGVYRFGKPKLDVGKQLEYYKDGKTSSVAVVKHHGGSISIKTNGKTDATIAPLGQPYSADEITMVMAAIVPLAIKPDSKLVANIGMGSGLTSHALLANENITALDTIEIEHSMVEGARLFGQRVERSFNDPRSSIFIDDAKSFFSNHQKKYDVIISEPSNPWINGVASLFSYEFYQHIQSYLKNDGVFVQWLQLYEIDMDNVASVFKALDKSFSHLRIYNTDNANILILASEGHTLEKLDPWIFSHAKMKRELKRVGIENMDDINIRYLGDKRVLTPLFSSMKAPMNSDYFPYLGYHAPKARYLQQDAAEISWLHINHVPVLNWLTGNLSQTNASKNGKYFQFYRNQAAAKLIVAGDKLKVGSQMLRFAVDIAQNCSSDKIEKITKIETFSAIAGSINPYLSIEDLNIYWTTILEICAPKNVADNLYQWLNLHYAISQRNSANTISFANQLLANNEVKTKNQINYLITAILTASVASADYQIASATVNKFQLIKNFDKQPLAIKMLVAILIEELKRARNA